LRDVAAPDGDCIFHLRDLRFLGQMFKGEKQFGIDHTSKKIILDLTEKGFLMRLPELLHSLALQDVMNLKGNRNTQQDEKEQK
jgi:hypothetical protein